MDRAATRPPDRHPVLRADSPFPRQGRHAEERADRRRLRIDDEWFRIDLVFYHRRLRCLMLIDLKLDKLTAGDVGQVHLYLNYAREHWTHADENPPVGLILCAE